MPSPLPPEVVALEKRVNDASHDATVAARADLMAEVFARLREYETKMRAHKAKLEIQGLRLQQLDALLAKAKNG